MKLEHAHKDLVRTMRKVTEIGPQLQDLAQLPDEKAAQVLQKARERVTLALAAVDAKENLAKMLLDGCREFREILDQMQTEVEKAWRKRFPGEALR